MPHDLPLITTIAAAFTAAWVLGIITQKLKLSPIVGYLLAGVVIGPHTPGFKGDTALAAQLAEIGVILLMFGVGLHFHFKDLLAVRNVAIPGALGQSAMATVLGVVVALAFGFTFKSGLVLGMAMAVASTVVLMRVLTDSRQLDTTHGHVAVGWLIVEDILTIVVLVLIPAMGTLGAIPVEPFADSAAVTPTTPAAIAATQAALESARIAETQSVWIALPLALIKLGVLILLLLVGGAKVIPWVMVKVARLRSRELFTLTVLVMAIAISSAAYFTFGASMALGAFLAGMVVGQSPVSQQAAADALPLRDAFAVLFFASVGMLFDPSFILEHPLFLLACLGVVMIGKPLVAILVVAAIGYPARTAIVVALGLAQIGEFSFILSELGRAYGIVGKEAHNALVATAIISITANPILFRNREAVERLLQKFPRLWAVMNRKALARQTEINAAAEARLQADTRQLAVILGYGPVGRSVDEILRQGGLETVIVDLNMETIQSLTAQDRTAIYGDAFNIEVLSQALPNATHLIITLPHSANRAPLIAAAKLINPDLKVFVRARYVAERKELEQVGADAACFEEAEVAVALSRLILTDRGTDADTLRRETTRLRQELRAETPMLRS